MGVEDATVVVGAQNACPGALIMPKSRFVIERPLFNAQASEDLLDALREACWEEAIEALGRHADPNAYDGACSALELAIDHDAPGDLIRALLACGANPETMTVGAWGEQQGVLFSAIQAGHKEAVAALIDHGACVNQRGYSGDPALHVAAKLWDDGGLTMALIERGAIDELPEDACPAPARAAKAWQLRQRLAAMLEHAASGKHAA
jgi:hypothetical protein